MICLGIMQAIYRIDLKIQLTAVDKPAAAALCDLTIMFAQLQALFKSVQKAWLRPQVPA